MSEYVLLNLRVTPEARDAWHEFAREEGVTASALAEAAGEIFRTRGDNDPTPLSECLRLAREITQERKDRRPHEPGQGFGQEMGLDEEQRNGV